GGGTDRARGAGISSFGVSGTNAHVIVEEGPPDEPDRRARPDEPGGPAACSAADPVPWLLSARTGAALRDQARQLADHLAANPQAEPADIGYTLATARTRFEHRAVVTGAERAAFRSGLQALSGA